MHIVYILFLSSFELRVAMGARNSRSSFINLPKLLVTKLVCNKINVRKTFENAPCDRWIKWKTKKVACFFLAFYRCITSHCIQACLEIDLVYDTCTCALRSILNAYTAWCLPGTNIVRPNQSCIFFVRWTCGAFDQKETGLFLFHDCRWNLPYRW